MMWQGMGVQSTSSVAVRGHVVVRIDGEVVASGNNLIVTTGLAELAKALGHREQRRGGDFRNSLEVISFSEAPSPSVRYTFLIWPSFVDD